MSANTMEQQARRAWLAWARGAYVYFGQCPRCQRTHDEGNRPLLVAGPRRASVRCLECFDLGER